MPGYAVEPYVADFLETPVGPVPRLKARLGFRDWLGTIRVRSGLGRTGYRVNPGLYCVGAPSAESPVLVTANYKLSVDSLRRQLKQEDAWILVVDTRGVNVWCAAGKKTFSAAETALQVNRAGLSRLVSHRELILPQFAAAGVASRELREKCGFTTTFGPIRAEDLPLFLHRREQVDEHMREVTFTLAERLVLIPVEIVLAWKNLLALVLLFGLVSGIGPEIYSLEAAYRRGFIAAGAALLALLTGGAIVPMLLPWIPARQFWIKGLFAGTCTGTIYVWQLMASSRFFDQAAVWLLIAAGSSYTAMNFTGATPYTSLSGVEREMKRAIPVHILSLAVGLVLWISGPFIV